TDMHINEMARLMKCDVGEFPFTYLGLPIRENMRRVGAWNTVIDKFKKRVVGNGKEIRFWLDRWSGEGKLCDRFPRLYHLDSRKEGRVANKGRWVDSEWRWEWEWVREIRGRKWKLQEDGVFTVKELAKMVDERTLRIENGGQETLWNKWVPNKVNIFVWRALKGRIPVREELDRRGIDLDTTLCPCCDSVVESCVHSLVLCNFAMSVWEKIFNWWKLGNVNAFSIGEIFATNGNVVIPKYSSHLWQAVIWTSGYFIWKMRNERVFKRKVSSVTKIVQDIQVKSFEWITRRTRNSSEIDWQQWIREPLKCRL
ncbi:reverse transcriptase domain, reverse transcriptase zinc-binding domain protein, partial [Tanacetum coccineum]